MPKPRPPRTVAEFRERCRRQPHCPRISKAFAVWLEQRGMKLRAAALHAQAQKLIERRNAMVVANQGLIGRICDKLRHFPGVEKHGVDECFSDGQLGLMRAAEMWDPDRGIAFSTYACRCIIRSILRAVQIDRLTAEREAAVPAKDCVDPTPTRELLDCELKAAIAALPPRFRKIILLIYYRGWNGPEVAGRLGISREAVRQRRNLALAALRSRLDAA